MQSSFEAVLRSPDLSTRFPLRSPMRVRAWSVAARASFDAWLLSCDVFVSLSEILANPFDARAFDLRPHLAMVTKSARKSCTPFGGPRRLRLSTLTTCSTYELASFAPSLCFHCGRRGSRNVFDCFTKSFRPPLALVHARVWLHLAALPNTPTARVHIQRVVIEKVWRFVSASPPCSSF